MVSPVVDHDIIAMRVTGSVRLTQRRAGRVHRAHAVPGNITIHPRGFESRWSWDRPGAIVLARVPREVLAHAADVNAKRLHDIELRNCFGVRDAFIEPIMNLFAGELQRPSHPVQALIAGCLSTALAGHLVQRFNCHAAIEAADPGGLAPHSLRRVLEYIHTPGTLSAQAPMTLARLAEIAGVSRFHFARRFRRSTGLGLVAYVRGVGQMEKSTASMPARQRHVRARGAAARPKHVSGLASWQVKRVTSYLIDHLGQRIDLDAMASLVDLSRSHFCTAFRLAVGMTPRAWLIDRRMERARELLANPGLSITEIALALGYTPSAFGAIFRRSQGTTPSAFRRMK